MFIYQIIGGTFINIYQSKERVYTFDFDSENLYLAIGTAHSAIIYNAMNSVISGGFTEMKIEYKYESKSYIIKLKFYKNSENNEFLVIATKEGEIVIVNVLKEIKIIINTNLNLLDDIYCFAATTLSNVSLDFIL